VRVCVPNPVLQCGDNLTTKFMGRFFSGLAQCGAWACFDEFNRIDIEVLSVVAQQLLTIQNALKVCMSSFNFEGRQIKLLPTCGVVSVGAARRRLHCTRQRAAREGHLGVACASHGSDPYGRPHVLPRSS
jgi:hypothetical protein